LAYRKSSHPAHAFKIRGGCEGGGKGYLGADEKVFTISTSQDQQIMHGMTVRRLTPTECERLQGFPDGWTDISKYKCCGITFNLNLGKYGCPNCNGENIATFVSTPDGPRYKAIGNSMAVPVMRWIGQRLMVAG